jgi:hypothetical protein
MHDCSNKKQCSRVSSERYKQKRNIISCNRAILECVMMVVVPITFLEVGMGVVCFLLGWLLDS